MVDIESPKIANKIDEHSCASLIFVRCEKIQSSRSENHKSQRKKDHWRIQVCASFSHPNDSGVHHPQKAANLLSQSASDLAMALLHSLCSTTAPFSSRFFSNRKALKKNTVPQRKSPLFEM